MNPKISADHLKRRAIIYIRQSSPGQVIHNQESQRRQYGLADHARQLGFQQVEVIDEDLGRSGSGQVERPGFQHLVAEVCTGQVGAVLCIEASRLARNGRDWHHLIELCGLVRALVIDESTIRSRIDLREDNWYGKRPVEFDQILAWNVGYAETYRTFGAVIVDAKEPLPVVVEAVIRAAANLDA